MAGRTYPDLTICLEYLPPLLRLVPASFARGNSDARAAGRPAGRLLSSSRATRLDRTHQWIPPRSCVLAPLDPLDFPGHSDLEIFPISASQKTSKQQHLVDLRLDSNARGKYQAADPIGSRGDSCGRPSMARAGFLQALTREQLVQSWWWKTGDG
uniref:Uncharacterized protein n=1 Tax=Setaria viridis TaxID=4556 RepID=A0A4U6SXE4_SETVI|nr:hypothetical protein SEVIR_9G235600v2 [Setaria viridis]